MARYRHAHSGRTGSPLERDIYGARDVSRPARRRSFGSLRRLPSGHIQARYVGPDGVSHNAPTTFQTIGDAEAWLGGVRSEISRGVWVSPIEAKAAAERAYAARQSLSEFAEAWLTGRARDLKPRTQMLYRSILTRDLLPVLGSLPLEELDPGAVRGWYATLPADKPTRRAHAYSLLRTILGAAVTDERIAANPCRIKGAGQAKRLRRIEPATLEELQVIVEHMPERFRAAVWVAAWCGLRFGELAELRRRDLDLNDSELPLLQVQRAMVYRNGQIIVGRPKSDAGLRVVAVPPHLRTALVRHLATWAQPGPDGLVFPAIRPPSGTCECGYKNCSGGHLMSTVLYKSFDAARRAAGRPDLRWHDLRHTGAVLAAQTGATLAELMARLGHSTVSASLRYQHAAQGRDAEIARRLSAHNVPPDRTG